MTSEKLQLIDTAYRIKVNRLCVSSGNEDFFRRIGE